MAKSKLQKARVCICARHNGELLKLTWINEDAQGVYVGMYGAHGGLHFSYHKDGRTHLKDPNGQLISEPSSQTPIASIPSMQQLIVSAVPLESEDAVGKCTDAFTGDNEAHCVFIGGEEFESSLLNIGEYILHRSAEAEFARNMYDAYDSCPDVQLVGFVVLPLTNFPDHKVALLITVRHEPTGEAKQ